MRVRACACMRVCARASASGQYPYLRNYLVIYVSCIYSCVHIYILAINTLRVRKSSPVNVIHAQGEGLKKISTSKIFSAHLTYFLALPELRVTLPELRVKFWSFTSDFLCSPQQISLEHEILLLWVNSPGPDTVRIDRLRALS